MKKIVLASAAMGGAALVAFGASGTFAAFSDQTTTSNAAGAGTLYLNAGSTQSSSRSTGTVNALAPGDTATYVFYAENAGNQVGNMTATFRLLSDKENGCTTPEARVDTSCDDLQAGNGELVEKTTVVARFGVVTGTANCTAATPGLATAQPSRLDTLNGASTQPQLQSGDGLCVVLRVTLPQADDNNVVQSDTAEFGIDYRLDQVTS